jgi:hypothetical protein
VFTYDTGDDRRPAAHHPAAGLEHRSGNLVATVTPTAQAGYRIQVRIGGVFNDLAFGHVYEYNALRAWNTLVAQRAAPV